MTSVGLKCLRANVDFPLPEMPTSTTSPIAGTVTCTGSVASRFTAEHRHLRGRAAGVVRLAYAAPPDGVAVRRGDPVRPVGELGPVPFESMVWVTHAAETFVGDVVFIVRRSHDHRPRPRRAEDHPLQGSEPRWVDMLDDLHQHSRVVTGKAVVLVGECPLEQVHPTGLALVHPLHPQPAGGLLQRTDVDTHNP